MLRNPRPPGRCPEGYPSGYEHRLKLRDGRVVWVRPVVPDDAPWLVGAIRTARADDLRQRWLGHASALSDAEIVAMTRLDYRQQFRLIVWSTGGDLVASGGYRAVLGPAEVGSAEVGLGVVPEWRRVGLGSEVLWLLATRAHECGVELFSAMWPPGNDAAGRIAENAGFRIIRHADQLVVAVARVRDLAAAAP
jgi:acetyltransferase